MRKISKLLLIVALASCTLHLWGQASTQGKEFWVSSSIVCSPAKGEGIDPYLAVSAEKACKVTITGGVGNAINITTQVGAGSWTEFNSTNGLAPDKWYPINTKEPATVCNLAGQKNMYGLHITATENISVYVILRGKNAMDASNILPLTALGSEYYVQDYTPEAHNDKSWDTNAGNMVTVTTILGTEDGTKVDITPEGNTYDGHVSGTPYTIELNKGQTYYLISQKEKQLAGTHIVAKNNRRIAIYTGLPLTRLPNGISARDALFEQPMPVEYWGTQFIATRSLGKNGNLIGITASNNGTEIKLDGYSQNPAIIINEGETYYIMLQNAGNPQGNKPGNSQVDKTITGDVLYIETSCPCQVYSYDTGNGYVGKGEDAGGTVINELVDGQKGDPSSVWVSPIQQKINKITFGACYTSLTQAHFLNVITETATCSNTKLTAYMGQYGKDWSDKLTWTLVPGNPTYSYARVQIGDKTPDVNVFTLENAKGFIATVYGNGDDESYAYSAGSAAVEQGVNVDGETFTNGYRSDSKFCVDTEMSFDAKVGTDEISRVDWNFGDGTTESYGLPLTTHQYTSPGWYDVTAELYGHQVCTNEENVWLGKVQFSFRVVRADTTLVAPKDSCLSLSDQEWIISEYGQEYLDSLVTYGGKTILNPDDPCYVDKQLSFVKYGLETETIFDSIARDSAFINGQWYYADETISWTVSQKHKCDQHFTYNLTVITCLKMDVTNNPESQYICPPQSLEVAYTKTKGAIKSAWFVVPGEVNEPVEFSGGNTRVGTVELPTESMRKPGIYSGTLYVEDLYCGDTLTFPIDFTVFYPSDIFRYKFNNVLAVYNSGYGGNIGYTFSAYQWYLNYEPIEGATGPVLYLGDGITFTIGDVVFVALTDMNGVTIPSCPQTITNVPDYTKPEMNYAPAQKMLIDGKFVILKDNGTYDIYGQKVQ